MKLRDKFWLWGHPEGRYNNEYGNTGISRMTPMEACLYLGVRNTFMVPVQRDVNRRQYNKSFKTLRQVGWEAFDMGGVEELIRTMTSHAVQLFGSGWVWLSADRQGRLFIEQRANAGNPMVDDLHPLLSIDVWEHAYYIDHHNLRGDGVAALWKVLDWSVIEARYERACNREKCHTSTDHNGYCKV